MHQIEKENLLFLNNIFNSPNQENKSNMLNQSNKPHISNKQNKNKAKINKPQIYNSSITYSALFFIICITIINQTTSSFIRGLSYLSNSYIIKIKINSSGLQRIFFKGADNEEDINRCTENPYAHPDNIIINGERIDNSSEVYSTGLFDFTGTDNNIEISWNEPLYSFQCLFYTCSEINEIDLTEYDTTDIRSMKAMFLQCSSLTSVKFGKHQTNNVEDLSSMFDKCSALEFLDISHFNTEKVVSLEHMFSSCFSLTSLDLSNFNTKNNWNIAFMFYECRKLSFVNLSSFNTSTTTAMNWLFAGCWSLTSVDISNFKTSNVGWMSYMFADCPLITSLDLSNFDTSSCSYFEFMFNQCSSLTSLDLKNFNTQNAVNMNHMFCNCISLTSLDLSNFNIEHVNDISSMFYGCKNLSYIDVSSFDTSNIDSMDLLFAYCWSLTTLDLSSFRTHNVIRMNDMFHECINLNSIDLSRFDTSSVSYFKGMFYRCRSLVSLDLKNFNTENALTMDWIFAECTSLKYLDISNFNTEKVTNMRIMFGYCYSLTYLDLSNFKTPSVTDFGWMFYGCKSLTSINLSNFITTSAIDMEYMFHGCNELTSIDLSKFETHNVVRMRNMFYRCNSLKYLDLSTFDTSKVTEFVEMFAFCHELTSINLESFVTSSVNNTASMFDQCHNLISLNLNHFDTSKVTQMTHMFSCCYKLKTLNIMNFNTTLVENMEWMFYECFQLTSLEISNFITSNVKTMAAMFVRCISITSIDVSNFDTSLVTTFYHTFEGCNSLTSINLVNFETSNVETMRAMFLSCDKLTSLDLSNFDTTKVTIMDYMFANDNKLKIINFKKLNIIQNRTTIFQLIDENMINPIICLDDRVTLDIIISIYHCPFINCSGNWGEKQEEIQFPESNLCIGKCLLSRYNNIPDSKCYQICSYYFYFDENEKKYICTEKSECPASYSKLIHEKNECVKSCSNTKNHIYEFNNICLEKCPDNFIALRERQNSCTLECNKNEPFLNINELKCTSTCSIKERQNKLCITNYIPRKDDDINIFNIILEQSRLELLNNFDYSTVDGAPIKEDLASITITRTKKENNDPNDINLGECKDRLKEHNNIQDELYLLRVDIDIGMGHPIKDYEVLYPIDGPNLKKLNMSICKDVKVAVERSPPKNITIDDIDKYNSSSPYYNDICYVANSDDGIDISLSDRKETFKKNNLSLCELDCDYIDFNLETQKAICLCGIKTEIATEGGGLDKDSLIKGFTDINNIANIKMLKCYNTVFNKKYILKNLGFFIIGAIIVLNLIFLLLFAFKYYNELSKEIEKIKNNFLKNKKIDNILNQRRKNINFNNIKETGNAKSRERKINKNIKKIKIIKSKGFNKQRLHKINNQIKINNNKIFDSNLKNSSSEINPVISNKNLKNKSKKGIWFNRARKNNKTKFLTGKNSKNQKLSEMKINISESNNMPFKEALIRDKRTFLEFYFSLIQLDHLFFYIFNSDDFNSQIIKLSIFSFNIASDIATNALFYNDSTMHKIYVDHGSYNLLYQLPQIIYSVIISAVLNNIIKVFGLTQTRILKFKKELFISKDINMKVKNLYRILRIKFTFFYFIIFSFLCAFWYYVTCFCGIYRNTQMHLIKDSLCSFFTSLLTPFAVNVLPGFLRIFALKKKYKCVYVLSQLF